MKKLFGKLISILLLLALVGGLVSGAFAEDTPLESEASVVSAEPSAAPEDPTETDVPAVTENPDPGTTESPDPEISEDPDPGATETPDPGTAESPDPGIPEDPDPGATETPDPGAPEEPDPEVTEDPDPGTTEEPVGPIMGTRFIRVGLRYGNNVVDGMNIGNTNGTGSGYWFGYFDGNNQFVALGHTDKKTISVVKTENVYYGSYGGYTTYYDHLTSASVGIGCYHLQLPGSYGDFKSAKAVTDQYDGGFVAYIGGVFYARIGNYLVRDAAVAAQESYAASGVSTELKGTSSYGVSVVATGSNNILFQYDDNGSGTGLGVWPKASYSGEKCVSVMQGTDYYGGFRYERIKGGDLTVVNILDMEDYANCVISQEMSDSWPLEALKAQAVAARSYAYTLRRHSAYHFDVCPSTHCQAYPGCGKVGANTTQAVKETNRLYVWSNDSVAQTVYYSSNGGASENSSVIWGGKQESYPYLLGVVDPYEVYVESMISNYNWTRTYTGDDLGEKLRSAGYTTCGRVAKVTIVAYTDMGNPKTVTFTDVNGLSFTLTAYAMNKYIPMRSNRYDLLNTADDSLLINDEIPVEELSGAGLYALDGNGDLVPVDNSAYLITGTGDVVAADSSGTVTGDTFTFVGKGWGHNIGLSQYGAYSMAKLGFTFEEILKFYYTGITVG